MSTELVEDKIALAILLETSAAAPNFYSILPFTKHSAIVAMASDQVAASSFCIDLQFSKSLSKKRQASKEWKITKKGRHFIKIFKILSIF